MHVVVPRMYMHVVCMDNQLVRHDYIRSAGTWRWSLAEATNEELIVFLMLSVAGQ